jgi:hypothetical protein
MLAVVLLGALLVSKSCGASGTKTSSKEAIAIAREQLDFVPKCVQIRYLRMGLQSQPVWAVSLWTLTKRKQFDRIAVVLVAARTGKVVAVNRHAVTQATSPQCSSPV